jgi:hypothetical protein
LTIDESSVDMKLPRATIVTIFISRRSAEAAVSAAIGDAFEEMSCFT